MCDYFMNIFLKAKPIKNYKKQAEGILLFLELNLNDLRGA